MATRKKAQRRSRQPEASQPQGSSRRRSLPALAKVRVAVNTMLNEALRRQSACTQLGLEQGEVVNAAKIRVLDGVLRAIAEVEDEEPEGNIRGHGHGTTND